MSRVKYKVIDDSNDIVADVDKNFVNLYMDCLSENNKLNIYNPPDDWVTPPPDTKSDEHQFDDVVSPGNWNSFSFRPVFKSIKKVEKYKHHCLPTGCIVVPKISMVKGRLIIGHSTTMDGTSIQPMIMLMTQTMIYIQRHQLLQIKWMLQIPLKQPKHVQILMMVLTNSSIHQ